MTTTHPKGVWTPWAQLLCPTCHNSNQRAIDRTSQADRDEIARPIVVIEPWHKVAPCDKCDALCWFADDVATPALVLRAVASDEGSKVTGNMWQTGGMCCAAAFKCEGDPRLVIVTADDVTYVGVYADDAAWEDFDEDRIEMFTFDEDDIAGAAQKVLNTFSAEGE